jgi:spore coat protein A
MKNRIVSILLISLLTVAGLVILANVSLSQAMPLAPTMDPKKIPKFVNQLPIPPVYEPTLIYNSTGHLVRYEITVNMTEFYQQILPAVDAKGRPTGFPMTKVWGYEGLVNIGGSIVPFRFSPGATFEATRGIPIQVKWVNNLVNTTGDPLSHLFPVDPTLHWANPNNMSMMPPTPWPAYPPGFPDAQTPVPTVTHLHGGEVPSGSDGGPEQWFTATGIHGPDYETAIPTDPNAAVYYYPNEQLPATLWYHDHALGVTRINVMSGLAGFYLLRDPADPIAPYLPNGAYEVPIVIQDRSFNLDGSFWFPPVGLDPSVHPYWQPEFFGDTIMVNGAVWPNLNVEPRQYRLRFLDGSNARFYSLSFVDQVTDAVIPFTQIGSDGGYLPAPVPLTSVTIAPGERVDIFIDFSNIPAGTKILLKNNAKAPFPSGKPAKGATTGQIMQFTVMSGTPMPPTPLPAPWPITVPTLTPDSPAKQLTLIEVMGALGPTEILLDGQKWGAPTSEIFRVGSTVDWVVANPTADTHPIHLHLVQFQVISRQRFDANAYMTAWMAANGMPPLDQPTINVPLAPHLKGAVMPPAANEMGWKDTVQMNPGEVTIIRVRYAPQDAPTIGMGTPYPGLNLFAFDPTTGPGYVWHCHILDHEDNEMMRRQIVIP